MTASRAAPDEDEDEWFDPDAEPEPSFVTGTALDEFVGIYRALAQSTKTHGSLSPSEVDAMDITIVAVLLGVGTGENLADVHAAWRAEWEAEHGPVGASRPDV